jgi:hypothetical protein
MKKKFVAIFHANMNYAFLTPDIYERTIRASYETIIDVFREKHPDQKYVFEASGYTIDQIAELTPDVLEKLKAAIDTGQCEFMGSPYAHPIMANVPEEDGRWSLEFSQKTYEKHLGMRAESFWNPECTWMQYVPRAFRDVGAKYLTLDFESYMACTDKEFSWIERNRAHDMNWGGHIPKVDIDPDNKFLHHPFRDIVPGLHGMCRSDRLIDRYIAYFLGRIPLEDVISNMKEWMGTSDKGSTIIIADDAEYCGTTGYFFVKYFRDYSMSFNVDPEADKKLDELVAAIKDFGQLISFKEACEEEPVEEPFYVEDRYAWHRTYADAWAGTPEARAWDPILCELRREYKTKVQPIIEHPSLKDQYQEDIERFWFHMTNSANSDGRWPPPPAETCEFNREWVLREIETTKKVLAELIEKTKDVTPPPAEAKDLASQPEWVYGYDFTEKDPEIVEKLNLYELQHAIYYFHQMVDKGDTEERKDYGRKHLKRVFDEFDRRGMKGLRPACIS